MKSQTKKITKLFSEKIRIIFFPNGSIFYGWWIVAVASFVMYLGSLFWVQSYGAYAVIFSQEFGWSMTLLAAAYTLTHGESGLLGPVQGWMADRYGPRIIISIGVINIIMLLMKLII